LLITVELQSKPLLNQGFFALKLLITLQKRRKFYTILYFFGTIKVFFFKVWIKKMGLSAHCVAVFIRQ